MTIAEIHGKISESGTNLSERMEDLLTSDIFGSMRYLLPEKALLPFLHTAYSFHGKSFEAPADIIRVHTKFWPWLKISGRKSCEPDVVIGLETADRCLHIVMIEVKYYSGLSSEEDERAEPNNQLARELDNLDLLSPMHLGWKPQLKVASRILLFVTQHMGIPRTLLEQSLAEYKQKRSREGDMFWASWRFLPLILEKTLQNEADYTHRAVLEDMLRLLLRKELTMFQGIESVTTEFALSDFDFYQVALREYQWPDIPKTINIAYEYMQGG